MVRFHSIRVVRLAVAALLPIAIASIDSARADDVDFAGKTISIVVGFDPGGGYDAWARLVADHIAKYLPGEPTVIVENMPGAGGNRATIFMAVAAPKDGTSISMMPQPFALDALVGRMGDQVKPDTFGIIGRLTTHTATLITWNTSPIKTIEDAKQRETTIATPGIDVVNMIARILNQRYGTKFKIVDGYKGTAEMALAMERGEVEGMSFSLESLEALHPDWVDARTVNFLWQVLTERHADLPDVPAIVELPVNDADHALFKLLANQGTLGRSLAAPPGVSPEILQAYRAAFDNMVQDADFVADAKRRGLQLAVESGETVQGYVVDTVNSPPDLVQALVELLKPGDE
jgi:tripartite-type tricarboxylate transporter receptor subunit TctC